MALVSTAMRRFCAFGAGLCMALVFLVIFGNASRRYLFGEAVAWGEELSIYLTIYGVMFGFALAYLTDANIRFSVLTDALSQRTRRLLFAGVDAVTVATGVALAWSGILFGVRRADRDASGLSSLADSWAQATGLPILEWLGRMGPWQFAIAFGGVLLTISAAIRFCERLADIREGSA